MSDNRAEVGPDQNQVFPDFPGENGFAIFRAMKTLRWDDGHKWDDKNSRWGDPSYVLEPGDPGYVPPDAQENKVMSEDNKISVVISPADKAAILQKISELAALMPWRVNIPAADKTKYTHIGTTRAGMDEVFLNQMTAHPELVPGYVDMDEVRKDVAFRKDWAEIRSVFAPVLEGGDDAALLASSDNFNVYSAFKHSTDAAAHRSSAGADTVKASLDPFYPTPKRAPKPTAPAK